MTIHFHRAVSAEFVCARRFFHSKVLRGSGFTLIELMIVIAVIAILLTLAIPTYSNYSIRAKIAEGLSVANAAKTATSAACQEDYTLTDISNALVGYGFVATGDNQDYVDDVQVEGTCTEPVITVTMINTGAPLEPIVEITGDFTPASGAVRWHCGSTNTPNHLLPDSCRS